MGQLNLNTRRQQFNNFLSDNIPGIALLIWTLLLIPVGMDAFASTSAMLWWYYPVYSIIAWVIIGIFARDKVWQTLELGLVAHGILFVCALLIVLVAWGSDYFLLTFVVILVFVFLSALLSSVAVLISSAIANRIRHWSINHSGPK